MKHARRMVLLLVAVGAVIAAMIAGTVVAVTGSGSEEGGEPVKVLLVGDSIMNQAGVFLEEALEGRDDIGAVEVVNEGRNGTGLLTPTIYDWKTEIPGLVEREQPDVVVVLFVGNYTSTDLWVNDGGVPIDGYTNQFFEEWEQEAREIQRLLAASGADVYWVNPPPMIGEEGQRRVTEFRQIHRRIAEDFTGVVLIDGTDALSTGDGGYAFELPDEDGVPQQVRTLDSVHLTSAGARRLADELARQVATSVRVAQLDAARTD